ncbi:MAG: hypothetical protein U9R79_18315 [Armatimonadota bacterium]|nr:hypothetical protein [Armatimonadota bacterium]
MVKLGMVGKVLIHNYPYGAYFNGTDAEALEERCTKRWMLELIRSRFPEPAAGGSRITHVWAGEREEAEAIAAGCLIENVCDTPEEVIESVDGVLVLDEDADFRADTVERSLTAGKSVYVDKTPAMDPARTRELVSMAVDRDLRLAAWSQLLFAPEAETLQDLGGGSALVTFNLSPDIVDKYGIHLVCSAFAAFGCDPVHMATVANGPGGPPMMVLSYRDGKDVVLRAGSDLPPRGSISYVGKEGGSVVVMLEDMAAMFDGSAAALARMFEEAVWPVPPEAIVRMTEAVDCLCG